MTNGERRKTKAAAPPTSAGARAERAQPFVLRPSSFVTSPWLRHLALALLAALMAGLLVFVAARGVGAALLFWQQQELFGQVAGTLGGGIEGLAGTDLRAARRELQRLDADYWRTSVLAGALAAALAGVGVYLRLER